MRTSIDEVLVLVKINGIQGGIVVALVLSRTKQAWWVNVAHTGELNIYL